MLSTVAKKNARNSHQNCSIKEGVQKYINKIAGKHLYQSPFLIMMHASACNFIKKEILFRKYFRGLEEPGVLLECRDVFRKLENMNDECSAKT